MAMAIAEALCNANKKNAVLLFLKPELHLHCPKPVATITTNTSAVQGDAEYVNAYDRFGCDLRSLSKQGRLKEALDVLHIMDQRGVRPDSQTYASLLQGCANMKALQEGKLVHAHMIDVGFNPDVFLRTKLVIMYAKCDSLVEARRVLDEMPVRNLVSWTAMIAAYSRHGYGEEALTLFYQMQRTGIEPDQFAFASVLPACANLAALEYGKEVHEDINRRGFQSNIFVGTALVNMYVKCGSIDHARHVFDKMPERNVVSWTTLIAGYARNGRVEEALDIFEEMPERNVVSWNAIIAGYAQNRLFKESLELFQQMQLTGAKPNSVTFATILSACANLALLHQGKEVHENIIKDGFQSDVFVGSALVDMYANCWSLEDSRKVFDRMPERNVVTWNAIIAGYAENGHFDEAIQLFRHMQLTDMKPNSITFVSVLPACAKLAALQQGKDIHGNIIRGGFESDVFVGSALIDMYAKCGSVEHAQQVFDNMPERNVVSWNAMIGGYAMHGCGKEAVQLFEQMQHSGIKPDHVTFIAILSACCHAGLVNDAWQYFGRMSRDYHIRPSVEHYCCMVDLLGRAGQLDDAVDFINKMPIKPTSAVWGSLLAACRIHSNMELGERVAERLFQSNPENSAHYVLLSNIYAAAGRWDDIEKVRKVMKEREIKKTPGCSWIEVNKRVYAFPVGDTSHPQSEEIYAELERLSGRMKEAGYVPDTNFVLHYVEEQQKEHILCHHSEKLAIAFGLINTSPGTPIQIVKNLRVCGDCHTAIKFISKIVQREIVVRDANRFHHFKDGLCSCGDYW